MLIAVGVAAPEDDPPVSDASLRRFLREFVDQPMQLHLRHRLPT